PRARQASDDSGAHQIDSGCDHDRDGGSRLLQDARSGCAIGYNDWQVHRDEFAREAGEARVIAGRISPLDGPILSLVVAKLAHAIDKGSRECVTTSRARMRARAVDPLGLLRARRECHAATALPCMLPEAKLLHKHADAPQLAFVDLRL